MSCVMDSGQCMFNAMWFLFVSCFFWYDHGSRGWYDNPQPALRPLLAQCATLCVLGCLCVCVVYGYCHTDSACLVSVRALYRVGQKKRTVFLKV